MSQSLIIKNFFSFLRGLVEALFFSPLATYDCILIFNYLKEDEKLLYYYPDDIDLHTKVRHLGLTEALIKFTK